MTTLAQPISYTAEDITRISKIDGKRYELIDGTLVEKPMSMRSNVVATDVALVLRMCYPKSRAHVIVEQPTYCFNDPRQMRKPDVVLVWAHRLAAGLADDELQIPPDLAVEIVSPTNTFNDVLARVEEYLNAGVTNIWIAVPARRDLYVYRHDGTLTRYREHETLKDEPDFPGLTFNIGDIFPERPTTATGT